MRGGGGAPEMPAHIYKNSEGKRIPGVTTVIGSNLGWNKGPLMHWAWEEGINGRDFRQTRDEAADTGTIAHAMVEAELKGKDWREMVDMRGVTDDMVLKALNALEAWQQWARLFSFHLVGSEISLVSEKHQYGGTIDVATIQDSLCILDLKTSNAVYEDHKIQLAAYQNLWDENNPDNPCKGLYLLRLGKNDGSFAYYYWPDLSPAWEAFQCLRELHGLKKKIA